MDEEHAFVLSTKLAGFDDALRNNEHVARSVLSLFVKSVVDIAAANHGIVSRTERETAVVEFATADSATQGARDIQSRMQRVRPRFGVQTAIHAGMRPVAVEQVERLLAIVPPDRTYVSRRVAEYMRADSRVSTGVEPVVDFHVEGIDQVYEIRPKEGTDSSSRRSFFEQIDANQKIPLDHFRERFPNADRKIGSVLDTLARKGILTRQESQNGEVEYSLRDARDLLNLPKLFEREIAEDQRVDRSPTPGPSPPTRYRIAPSVVIGFGALAIIVAIITERAFFPVAIIGGAVAWFLYKKGKFSIGRLPRDERGIHSDATPQKPEGSLDGVRQLRTSIGRRLNSLSADRIEAVGETQIQFRDLCDKMENLADQSRDFQWMIGAISPVELEQKQLDLRKTLEEHVETIRTTLKTVYSSLQQIDTALASAGQTISPEMFDSVVLSVLRTQNEALSRYLRELKDTLYGQ